jgi:hypothetical protein
MLTTQGLNEAIAVFKERYVRVQQLFVGLGGAFGFGLQQGLCYWQALDARRYSFIIEWENTIISF